MANFRYTRIPTVARDVTGPASLRAGRAALLMGLLLLGGFSAQAQWLSQSFTLKPGWNAIYLHVDASHLSLDQLIPDANSPVAEVWLWRPKLSTAQFIADPNSPTGTDSRWAVWTSARGDTDTLLRLVGNGAYLVRNRTASDFTLTILGKPVPPAYRWTTDGRGSDIHHIPATGQRIRPGEDAPKLCEGFPLLGRRSRRCRTQPE